MTTLIDAETSQRQAADTLLTNNLATETSQRQAADSTLTNGLSTEIATRLADDDTLQGNIDSEASSRTTQDANIQSQVTINTNKLGVLLDSGSAMDEISEIVAAYGAADSSLQASLTALVNLRPLTTYVDSQDDTLEASVNVEKGRIDALVAGTTVDTFLEVKGVTDTQDGRITTLESTSATQGSLATQTARIDAIVANTSVDTFGEVKVVTDSLSSSIIANAGSISTNGSGVSTNLSTNNSQAGLITSNATGVTGNTSSIQANDAEILALQTKTAAVSQAEIASLVGIGASTVASQLAEKSSKDAIELWQANKTIKTATNQAFCVKNESNVKLFTCDTNDMEVQMPALVIDADGLNLASGKTIKFNDTLLAMSNLSDGSSYSTTSVTDSARTSALASYSSTSTLTGQLAAKQDNLSVGQIAVCDGDVFPASSYSTTSVTDSARTSALASYSTTSTLTGQLSAKQDNLSVGQIAVCDGDAFTASSYSTTSVTDSARTSALASYSTTSTLTGQLAAKQDNLSVGQIAVCDGDAFTASSYSTTSVTDSARTSALGDYSTTSVLTGQLAAKASLSTNDQIWTGRQILGIPPNEPNAGSVDGRLTITSNSGGANSLLIIDSSSNNDSCSIYLRHGGGNKFSIGLDGSGGLKFVNRATGNTEILLPIGGGVYMPNVPTSDPGAAGQLWRDGTDLKISTG